MPHPTEASVLQACRTLFGPQLRLSRDFLLYLQPEGAKTAYRTRAKETHPDLHPGRTPSCSKRQASLFQEVSRAYEVVRIFLDQREQGAWPISRRAGPAPPRTASGEHPRREETTEGSNAWFRGSCPPRPLEFGQYLYFRGAVPYQAVIRALVWQRRQRPAIGEIARRWGWLTEADIRKIRDRRGSYRRFGERAAELGLLSPFQVQTLLRHQRSLQRKLGEYFVEQGLLSAPEIESLVREMREHNFRARTASG